MRKQYYFRQSNRGLLAWDVDRLVDASREFPVLRVALSDIRELDAPWSRPDGPESWRTMIEHMRLIDEADLSFPIILSAEGDVMDGMHRVAKALQLGQADIAAVRFPHDPAPDHIGVTPDALPY